MSTHQTSAENFLGEAFKLGSEARDFLSHYDNNRATEFSQRRIEFSVKAVLLVARTKFPYTHDPASDLRKVESLPEWFRRKIPRIELWSRLLADARAFAIYGDVGLGVPPREIIDRKLAEAAVDAASEIYADCLRLANELGKASS